MITGSNTNIRHRGRLFHVQTEDSGREHPHVISHLYYQGTILGSEKTTYADLMSSDDLDARTSGGRVEVEHGIAVRGRLERSRVVGKINGGGRTLQLRTSGGSIQVRAR